MNLLSVDDLSTADIHSIFNLADEMRRGAFFSVKQGTTIALLFQKPSTRTRVSFESAMARLNGHSIYIDANTSQLSRGESWGDTAMVLSSYVHLIAARLFRQDDLIELASHSSIPVINALTDIEHPCQAMSDIYTVKELHKGGIRGAKIAFVGDIAANTANSLMVIATKLGASVTLLGPKGYQPNHDYVKLARKYGDVEITNDIKKGVSEADFIYTDTFVSMGQEKQAKKRRKLFEKYQVNSKMLQHAKRSAFVMHCLPAHRGEEITSDVLDGNRSIVWQQARNKMLLEQAIILYLYKKERSGL